MIVLDRTRLTGRSVFYRSKTKGTVFTVPYFVDTAGRKWISAF